MPDRVHRPLWAVLLIPTGIGCAIGGYAGDGLPVARAIASVVDGLITHPNVLNGAQLYWPLSNVLYVEGYGLDQFAAGRWALQPVHRNRVGVILDAGIEPELRLRHLQAMDAARATLGLDLTEYVVTDAPLGVAVAVADSGSSWGTIQRPDSLLRAAERLLTGAGAEAIAVVARFPDDGGAAMLEQYRQGQGVDPIAGAEAVISHLVVHTFRCPCAHAPALNPLPLDAMVSPRSAAEELGYTFLPCVLVGLSRAPRFCERSASGLLPPQAIAADQVDVVVTPASACGGSALLQLGASGAQIIAVEDNETVLAVSPESLGLNALRVRSYMEAVGAIASLRAGIDPRLLQPQIPHLRALP